MGMSHYGIHFACDRCTNTMRTAASAELSEQAGFDAGWSKWVVHRQDRRVGPFPEPFDVWLCPACWNDVAGLLNHPNLGNWKEGRKTGEPAQEPA